MRPSNALERLDFCLILKLKNLKLQKTQGNFPFVCFGKNRVLEFYLLLLIKLLTSRGLPATVLEFGLGPTFLLHRSSDRCASECVGNSSNETEIIWESKHKFCSKLTSTGTHDDTRRCRTCAPCPPVQSRRLLRSPLPPRIG